MPDFRPATFAVTLYDPKLGVRAVYRDHWSAAHLPDLVLDRSLSQRERNLAAEALSDLRVWFEGNWSCDCNRRTFLLEALEEAGLPESELEALEVLRALLETEGACTEDVVMERIVLEPDGVMLWEAEQP